MSANALVGQSTNLAKLYRKAALTRSSNVGSGSACKVTTARTAPATPSRKRRAANLLYVSMCMQHVCARPSNYSSLTPSKGWRVPTRVHSSAYRNWPTVTILSHGSRGSSQPVCQPPRRCRYCFAQSGGVNALLYRNTTPNDSRIIQDFLATKSRHDDHGDIRRSRAIFAAHSRRQSSAWPIEDDHGI